MFDGTGGHNTLAHTNIQGNDWEYFLARVKPYRDDLTVCCECTFNVGQP